GGEAGASDARPMGEADASDTRPTREADASDTRPTREADASDTRPTSEHRFCGWLHEFPDSQFTELGYDTFARQAGAFDVVHPKWWRVDSATTFTNHPAGREAPYGGFHDDRVLRNTTNGGGRTTLVPLIAATTDPDNLTVHAMINDPALRREHVANLVKL